MKDFKSLFSGKYGELYEPMRKAMSAMGKAMWHFAQIKEITWAQWGFEGITRAIHYLEHQQPEYIDSFKGLMAMLGLPLIYPPIPDMPREFNSLSEVLEACIGLVDEVNEALSQFIEAADLSGYEPLARQAENIQMQNFAPRAWLTQALTMSLNPNSESSVDSWLRGTLAPPMQG